MMYLRVFSELGLIKFYINILHVFPLDSHKRLLGTRHIVLYIDCIFRLGEKNVVLADRFSLNHPPKSTAVKLFFFWFAYRMNILRSDEGNYPTTQLTGTTTNP